MNLKEFRKMEKAHKHQPLAFRKGIYIGVLAGCNDPKVRKEAEYQLNKLNRKIAKKNRGNMKV